MPKNVLVVGMPRSGTSMTASIFTKNGYFVTKDEDKELRPSDEFNPSGYWEASQLITMNDEIFSAAGYEHDNTWLYAPISSSQSSAINNLKHTKQHRNLVEAFNQHQPWIWKDPRLCYTLGYWWPLLPTDSTKILLLKRDPNEIYNSFLRLKWRSSSSEDKKDVLMRIKSHIETAEETIKKFNIPHIVIHYSDYKNNPKETAKKISDFFEINISENDLGYKHKYNNQSLQGTIIRVTNAIGDLLPNNVRTKIKKIIPASIWKIINPHRYKN